MYEHSKHKDRETMYRYSDKDRVIKDPNQELVSSANWDVLHQFGRLEDIPEQFHNAIRGAGVCIYFQTPSETFGWLSKGSLRHRVSVASDGSVVVISTIDSSKASLEAFQAIVQIALQQEQAGHIKISNPHESSLVSGNLYDQMIISRE
jgi:hypothetical protein